MDAFGRKLWVIPGGHIPLRSGGPEPEFTSRDEIALLNAGDAEAQVSIEVYHPNRDPVGPYRLTVQPRRLRKVRFNDLIFPEALFLDEDYAAIVWSSQPIVVQFTRLHSAPHVGSLVTTIAHADP